jgi:hypothetical protein
LIDDLPDIIPVNEIVIHFATFGPERGKPVVGSPEIEKAFICIVEKYPIVQAVMDTDIKRESRIEVIVVDLVAGVIGIPVGMGFAPAVEVAGFFAQTNELFSVL